VNAEPAPEAQDADDESATEAAPAAEEQPSVAGAERAVANAEPEERP
jgi:hypothetical protein